MLEIYTIAGGEWLRGTFNAIAAFMGTETWTTIERMAILFSVLIVAVNWVKKHNVMDLLGWCFALVFVSLLVLIRTPIQIIDNSDVTRVYQVDNVPVGLALPASLTTRIGNALVQTYELIFAQPDSVTYSKTGMLFGASLVSQSTDFLSQNPEITTLFSDYVQNCVMGDIFLNHKYSFEELMNSSDPYTLIFSNPSPLRGVFDQNNVFHTCAEASVELKNKLALDTNTGGRTWHYYARQLFGGKPNPDLLFSQLIGDSYGYFYASGQNASQIVRQNVTLNALRGGIMSYAARSGDTSSLLNIATTTSLEKQRLAHASVGQVALRSLPIMQTVLMGILIGLFPIMVLAGMFNAVTMPMIKGYVFTFMWLQTWPLLYAVLNNAMTYYAKQNGVPVMLSELSRVQVKYSDIATTAGYISMMIPFLSWKMVMGLGQAFSSISSSLGSASLSSTSASSSSVVDGNYSYGNMQTENVNGYSWNTNSSTSFGQLTNQLANGGMKTQTRDGSYITDSSGSTSKTPVDIMISRSVASAQQQMARESESQAQTAMHGYNSSVTSAWNSLSQFASNRGNSASMVSGADNSQNSQASTMQSKMWNAVTSNAKANNISNEESFQALMDKTSRSTLSGEAYLSASASTDRTILGKVASLAVGGNIEAGAKGSVGHTWGKGSSDNVTEGHRQTNDSRHDVSAQAAQDFKESSDYLTSHRTSQSGNLTDNNASSRVDQLSASLNTAKNSYDQYTNAQTRSHEYAEMASRTESMSGQMSQNLTQQFANFVRERAPEDADNLLTDAGSPEIAAKREELAREFVRAQVAPKVDAEYSTAKGSLGGGMSAIPQGGSNENVQADYARNNGHIEARTQQAGIKDDVANAVEGMINNNQTQQKNTQHNIGQQSNEVKGQYTDLEKHHKTEQSIQNKQYNNAKENQESLIGAKTRDELLEQASKLEKENNKGENK